MNMKTLVNLCLASLLLGCTDQAPDITAADAAAIHARLLTVDTHMDTPLMLMRPGWDVRQRHDARATMSQVDLPRIREGGLDAGFWVVFLQQGELSEAGAQAAVARAERIFARIRATVAANPSELALATTPDEVRAVVAAGKHAVLIGVENGYALGGDIANVQHFYDLGARYIGLLHTSNNDLGDSSTDRNGPLHNGLSEFGREVVGEMNRLGIMVDVSHASDQVFWDVLELSTAPPIASHSSARAVHDHPRNLTDDMLRAIAARGGVVQVNTLGSYIATLPQIPERQAALAAMGRQLTTGPGSPDEKMEQFWQAMGEINAKYPPPLATLAIVADHIDHMVDVMGIDHVGVGADFDGGGGVNGMIDVSEIGNLTHELLRRGYSEDDLRKIWSDNLLRVMAQVQGLATPTP
jgi:membrane dipeptidase